MNQPVDTKDPRRVMAAVQDVFRSMFPSGSMESVERVFSWATACFYGGYPGYQAIDVKYHDLEHTLQATWCLVRILKGRQQAGIEPELTEHQFLLGLCAILLHDAGYLKQTNDLEGTGAKYTLVHVDRSAALAARLLAEKGYTPGDIEAVQRIIQCTGVKLQISVVPFRATWEHFLGSALGTADLLGQIAAADYIEKLPVLYEEFAEAARFNGSKNSPVAIYGSVDDLLRKTPEFWEKIVWPRLENDFAGVYRFLNEPYPYGPNDYLIAATQNLARLKQLLGGMGR